MLFQAAFGRCSLLANLVLCIDTTQFENNIFGLLGDFQGNFGRMVLDDMLETQAAFGVTGVDARDLPSLIFSIKVPILGSTGSTPGRPRKTLSTNSASCMARVRALVETNLHGELRLTEFENAESNEECAPSNTKVCLLFAAHSEKTNDRRDGVVGVEGVLGGWNTKGEQGFEFLQVVALEINPGEAMDKSCAGEKESLPGEYDLLENEETEFLDGEP
mmetsp:Transcript_32803/g.73727  ORF Transcript_32803/g.73727 Transcript_32803/m.73727 type:complete len:218 (-) Transcript_32803:845-1498(-)